MPPISAAAKFWAAFGFAVVIGGLTAIGSALGDNVISAQEWVTIGLAFVSAGAVYFIPNKPLTPPKE